MEFYSLQTKPILKLNVYFIIIFSFTPSISGHKPLQFVIIRFCRSSDSSTGYLPVSGCYLFTLFLVVLGFFFVVLGLQSVVFLVHLLLSTLIRWPVHFHFCLSTRSAMSITIVFCLIHSFVFRSCESYSQHFLFPSFFEQSLNTLWSSH